MRPPICITWQGAKGKLKQALKRTTDSNIQIRNIAALALAKGKTIPEVAQIMLLTAIRLPPCRNGGTITTM